jgi:hypothetical protein
MRSVGYDMINQILLFTINWSNWIMLTRYQHTDLLGIETVTNRLGGDTNLNALSHYVVAITS